MILPLLNKSICRNIFPFIIFFPLFGLKAEATAFQTNEEDDSARVNALSVFLVVQEFSSLK